MTDPREKTERTDILSGQPAAWRFPFDSYHTAHTSDPIEAAKYRDAEPLFTADEPGLWRFWNEKAQKLAGDKLRMQADHDEAIASLRQELAEARAKALEEALDAVKSSNAPENIRGTEYIAIGPLGVLSRACAAIRSLAAGKEGS